MNTLLTSVPVVLALAEGGPGLPMTPASLIVLALGIGLTVAWLWALYR